MEGKDGGQEELKGKKGVFLLPIQSSRTLEGK